jgi:hypothetical protein
MPVGSLSSFHAPAVFGINALSLLAPTAAPTEPELVPEPDEPAVVTEEVTAADMPAGAVVAFVVADPEGVEAQPAARATPSRTSRARAAIKVRGEQRFMVVPIDHRKGDG